MPSRKKEKRNRENLKIKFLMNTPALNKKKTCDSLNCLVVVLLENVEQRRELATLSRGILVLTLLWHS